MRVVFFLQGDRVPAARARGFEIARRLQAAGVTCDLRVARPSVYGDTTLPGVLAWPRPLYSLVAVVRRLFQLRDLRPDDVVFFQRPIIELPITLLERLAARGRRTIFDFDDAIYLNRGGRIKLPRLVRLVDQVIAGNPTLAEAAGVPDKTTVIPTVVDTDRLRPSPPRASRGKEVVLGWTGLASNYPQLESAAGGIGRALARTGARLVLLSNLPPTGALAKLGCEFRRWRPDTEAADLADMDIGLMPLPDRAYARGKCAYKLLQYMALGIPGVASPVGVNTQVVTDGVDGFLPADDAQWEQRLVQLIEQPALRADVGSRARRRVEAAYSYQAVMPRYLEILARLGVRPAGQGGAGLRAAPATPMLPEEGGDAVSGSS
jgi:glycosyltransferase involved in cell wall biosynthesis